MPEELEVGPNSEPYLLVFIKRGDPSDFGGCENVLLPEIEGLERKERQFWKWEGVEVATVQSANQALPYGHIQCCQAENQTKKS